MSIEKIVADWLRTHGYDGLAGEECGCELDGLMPCGEPDVKNCVAGHRVPCERCEGCGGWRMAPGPKKKKGTLMANKLHMPSKQEKELIEKFRAYFYWWMKEFNHTQSEIAEMLGLAEAGVDIFLRQAWTLEDVFRAADAFGLTIETWIDVR